MYVFFVFLTLLDLSAELDIVGHSPLWQKISPDCPAVILSDFSSSFLTHQYSISVSISVSITVPFLRPPTPSDVLYRHSVVLISPLSPMCPLAISFTRWLQSPSLFTWPLNQYLYPDPSLWLQSFNFNSLLATFTFCYISSSSSLC